MRYLGHWIAALSAVLLIAAAGSAALAQDRWPPPEGEVQSEPVPEPEPDPRGAGEADYGEFHQQLRPHGEWIEHPQYGAVWSPYVQEQEPDWRPYTRGQWILTDEHGWYWESEEPWGWATYHYGRWYFDPGHGWVWVPGAVWGPAWVAWRESDDAIGWAPLPPDADWYPDRGIVYRSGYYLDGPRYAGLWVFVGASALLAPSIYRHFYPRSRNAFYIGRSRHVTSYHYDNRRIFNRGINPRIVERRIGRPIAVLPVRPVDSWRGTQFNGGQRSFVGVYRPQIAPRVDGRPASRPPFADRQPARTTPPNFDPRRIDPQRPPIERDRGLPRPEVRREPPPGRPSPSPSFDPRFGRATPDGGSRPTPRDVGRSEERRRDVAPPPRNGGSSGPPPAARANPPPEVRRAAPAPENRGGSQGREGERRKEPAKKTGPENVQGRGPNG